MDGNGTYLLNLKHCMCSWIEQGTNEAVASRHVVEQIMECRYNFDGRRWKRVSQQAKSFVEDLLVKNPDERLTAEEAAGSTWLNRRFAATTRGPSKQEMDNTTTSLTAYANYHKLKKLVRIVLSRHYCVSSVFLYTMALSRRLSW
jgi:serine/threonine protein kinase